jgi:ABC-type uncharacterized transport system ATPase subunit
VEKQKVSECLASILAAHAVDDISVVERPLEDVIAELFSVGGEVPTGSVGVAS